MWQSVDILIVGGGIAGLSTALHLGGAGVQRIMLVDREPLPGFYASGHNAGIARQLTGCAPHTALAIAGRHALDREGLLRLAGGLLLCADAGGLLCLREEADGAGVPVEFGDGPLVAGLRAAQHLYVPSDGVIDVHGLLDHCVRGARGAGVHLHYACEVLGIQPTPLGFEVETTEGRMRAKTVINAAGAWAGGLGWAAAGADPGLRPMRRHLAWSKGGQPLAGPYAWWVDRPLYLRPESGGLLMSPCDEGNVALPCAGAQPDIDPAARDLLAATFLDLAPGLANRGVDRLWAGIRTFAADRRFLIRWDPLQPDLFWVAGLGGHGMTAGLAIGKLAAERILSRLS